MYRVMVADDEGIVIDSMKFIIEKEFGGACQVECAKSGRSVIELAERFRPDIAVMDIHMPGINGIEAMKEIKQFSAGTIFIVMSAYDKFDYAKEAIKLGVLEYINKPMDRMKVITVLKKAMAQISKLWGCEVHSTVILSQVDERIFKRLGINLTCEPKYSN